MSSIEYRRIISLGRAVFGPTDKNAHSFDVLVGSRGRNQVAYLIAYVKPDCFVEWKVFMGVETDHSKDPVEELEKEIQKKMDVVLEGAEEDRIWIGSFWI